MDSTQGMADDILGESNNAAGSPFSALCMAWKITWQNDNLLKYICYPVLLDKLERTTNKYWIKSSDLIKLNSTLWKIG